MPELLDIYLGYNFYVKSDGDVELAKDCGTVEAKDMRMFLIYIQKIGHECSKYSQRTFSTHN